MSSIGLSFGSALLGAGTGLPIGALLIGGNPGRPNAPGGICIGGPFPGFSFLNLFFILNQKSFTLCLKIINRIIKIIKITNNQIHHLLVAGGVVDVLQQT